MAEKWFATTPVVHNDAAFGVGDELHRHFSRAQLEALEQRGEASREAPAGIRAAYALVPLSYHAAVGNGEFRRGDRIDRAIPASLVAQIVEPGDASYERPGDVQPVFAVVPLSHKPHGSGVDLPAGSRIDGRVPDDILDGWVRDGSATYDEEAVR